MAFGGVTDFLGLLAMRTERRTRYCLSSRITIFMIEPPSTQVIVVSFGVCSLWLLFLTGDPLGSGVLGIGSEMSAMVSAGSRISVGVSAGLESGWTSIWLIAGISWLGSRVSAGWQKSKYGSSSILLPDCLREIFEDPGRLGLAKVSSDSRGRRFWLGPLDLKI